MENLTELTVTAMQCADCGTISERPLARCQGHDVSVVSVKKRFYKCAGCGFRTSVLARRMPDWGCERCKTGNWLACSMYGKRKVRGLRMLDWGCARGKTGNWLACSMYTIAHATGVLACRTWSRRWRTTSLATRTPQSCKCAAKNRSGCSLDPLDASLPSNSTRLPSHEAPLSSSRAQI